MYFTFTVSGISVAKIFQGGKRSSLTLPAVSQKGSTNLQSWINLFQKVTIPVTNCIFTKIFYYRFNGKKQCGRVSVGIALNDKLGRNLQ